ncbi:phosphoribosyltransferase [Psychromonas antarctica]|uniref:phosphoribosyltransferase n=1 Tax=Psychromonas antarctica TaxID=67573 RepID=UPI001EE7DF25|nr:phosphoribosyltransferase family protein [Psychromonas antarctica]MCG6200899.1 hypothetical protein [Psychromonas antarctica]
MGNKQLGKLVLSEAQIKDGVKEVARQLNEKFQGSSVVVITVVPGGILFTADLVRELLFNVSMDYISCPHIPGSRDNNSPIAYHQNINIKGKHVIVIDDAIESGGTMKVSLRQRSSTSIFCSDLIRVTHPSGLNYVKSRAT